MDSSDNTKSHPIFNDTRLKAHWASLGVDQLGRVIQAYHEIGVQTIIHEANPGNNFRKIEIRTEPMQDAFPLQIGDLVRNLRASMDYAVSAIYGAHGATVNHAYFPIGNDRQALEGTINGGLVKSGFSKLREFFLDEVEATQTGSGNALWALNQLDRAVKHRNLTVLTGVAIAPLPNIIIERQEAGKPSLHYVGYRNRIILNPGENYEYSVPLDSHLEDDANSKPTLLVTFGPSEVFAGREVYQTVFNLRQAVVEVLKKLEQKYISEFVV